jgi:hypothetical protein
MWSGARPSFSLAAHLRPTNRPSRDGSGRCAAYCRPAQLPLHIVDSEFRSQYLEKLMKALIALVVGAVALLTGGTALAQNGHMMGGNGMWGGGWMGFGGIVLLILVALLVGAFVVWALKSNRK